jgi:hypothetical protein
MVITLSLYIEANTKGKKIISLEEFNALQVKKGKPSKKGK